MKTKADIQKQIMKLKGKKKKAAPIVEDFAIPEVSPRPEPIKQPDPVPFNETDETITKEKPIEEKPKKRVSKKKQPVAAGLMQEDLDKIKAQVKKEIAFDRDYKQGKVSSWQKNEEMYYAKKMPSDDSRANVDLARMQEFVHTLLSKIDNPLIFKFLKRKEAQIKRVELLNALRQIDSINDDWDIKDIVGKKQGVIYGRAVYFYYADSIDGNYDAHLENTDVYDFLVDPSAGGINIENARHLGRYGIIRTRQELEDGDYIKAAVQNLLQGNGNNTETSQEETNKSTRMYGQNTTGQKELTDEDKFKFWEWYTTYKGIRYRVIAEEQSGEFIQIDKLTDLFSPTKDFPMGAWPVWTWAAFPDLTEFWTPSYCDYAREIFQAQNVTINQMLDNGEQTNKPQKAVNVNAIENLNEVRYKKDGIIRVKGDFDVNKAVQVLAQPSITTAAKVYEILEAIQEKASGITAGSKGVADEQGKVGIYEGNQQATADRFGLLNKSYAFGYKRFAKLYEIGVRDNLSKKVAVDILGPNGIETKKISKKDIFYKDDDFSVSVEASNAEEITNNIKQESKIKFLESQKNNQEVNQKKRFELEARAAGLNEDEIKQLLDTSDFANAEVMAEAERDIEMIIDGEEIKPNAIANNAYKQRMVDYMRDHEEDMTQEQFMALADYIQKLDKVIMTNEARGLNTHLINTLNQAGPQNGVIPPVNTNNPVFRNNGNQIQNQEG